MKLVVEQGENEYRIVAWSSAVGNPDKPDYEGEFVEYGDVAYIDCALGVSLGDWYMSHCDWDEATNEIVSCLPIDDWVAGPLKKTNATVEDIEIEGDEEPDVEAAIAEIEGGDEEEDEEEDEGHE